MKSTAIVPDQKHCTANLFVLIRCHRNELRLWEGVAGDHPPWAPDPNYVDTRLVLVKGI